MSSPIARDVLSVRDLTAGYVADLPVIMDISISLKQGSLTVIIGPNGAGKSTLIKAIAGLVPKSGGSVVLKDSEIKDIRPDQMGDLGLAYVPQTDNIFRGLNVRQNLALSLRKDKSGAASRIEELYNLLPDLRDKRDALAGSLSGGQRQMLALAMALARRPSVVLMDEPSAGLSPKVAEEVLTLVADLTRSGVSVLLVEQNVRLSLAVADHCYILAEGRNQIDGEARQLANDPVVGEIYLGARRMGAA